MGDRKNKPTHERLYDLNKERMQKHAQNLINPPVMTQTRKLLKGEQQQQQ